jgi:cbb3-type cytochrome c oxidase subunit I/cbb3-type cytochrome c oxidase subunit II
MNVRTETRLIRAHAIAALLAVGYTTFLGLMIAIKFHVPDWLGGESWLTWGRLRYAHTQGVFFGWLGNAFLMFLYYAVPRLAERNVTSRSLGYAIFFVWNFLVVLPGWALVQMGISQPLEWAEFPIPVDAAVIVAFVFACVQFVVPLLRSKISHLYVSGWYIMGGLIFTSLAYPVGNFVPEVVPGARGAAFSGLWIHDAIGLYVTPLALAIAYLVIPISTRKPIFSHFLSMIGFWLLFLVYPLNGTHHYIFSSIPMEAQKGAIVASVYLGMDVILVVANQLLSLRGSAAKVASDAPLRFVWVGVVCYLIVSLQGSLQALMPVNRFVHFSDWVIAHAHLALIGFASFIAIGGMLFVWKRLAGSRYNPRAADWAFWLLAIGLATMFLDLTIAGLVQAQSWSSHAPWIDSVRASRPYWIVRSFSGGAIILAFVAVALSMTTGARVEAESAVENEPSSDEAVAAIVGEDESETESDVPRGLKILTHSYVVISIAGLAFFALSFLVLAVLPNRRLADEIARSRPIGGRGLSAAEARGRAVYIREGCVNCHSQFVRFVEDDVRRFGIATRAWEAEQDSPQLWGTRRVGPDLAREHGKRSLDWHLVHLWNPRYVVPESPMPGYRNLFDGSPSAPRREAYDLAAYLESLGREAHLAGLTGPQPLPGVDPNDEKRKGMFCDCAIPRSIGAAPVFSTRGLEASERERFARSGAESFERNCAGCHGERGRGDGPAAVALLPRPRDLTSARFSDRTIGEVLWNGSRGSSMPAWNELPSEELRGLTAFVGSLYNQKSEQKDSPLRVDEVARARGLFAANCVVCHGKEGAGDGISATNLAPAPSNFHRIEPTLGYAEGAIERGVPGTAMPTWRDKLKAEDRALLARYVRTLFQPIEKD